MDKGTCNRIVDLFIQLSELDICKVIISMRLDNDLNLYHRSGQLARSGFRYTIRVDYGYSLDNPNIVARFNIGEKIIDCYSVRDLEKLMERLIKLKVMI